jgi:hypothetical protein
VTDAEEALSFLQSAVADNNRANPHAPLQLGRSSEFQGQSVQALLVLRPCRCGAPIAQALFMSASSVTAIREATRFVRALVKDPDE